ncbi:MAG: tetratricopeptide repeat protein [Myxococcales bacterium FL481]|nr:MAG: tetratricopeptide repeat protein [Myxococcales bacterium FL481]
MGLAGDNHQFRPFDRPSRPHHAIFAMPFREGATALLVATLVGCAPPAKVSAPSLPADPQPSPTAAETATPPTRSLGATPRSAGPRERPEPSPVVDRAGAIAAVQRGNPEGAIAFLRPLVREQPDDREAALLLARALVNTGDLDGAATTLRSLEDATRTPDAWRRLADIETRRGAADRAEALLRDGRRRHPQDITLKGALLAQLARSGQARNEEASKLRDELYDAYDAGQASTPAELLSIAQAALSRGTGGAFHDANMVLSDAGALAPASTGLQIADEIALLHAAVFLEKYATSEAASVVEEVLARDPWQPDALALSATIAITNLDLASAENRAREALLVDPGHSAAHAILAQVDLVEGRHDVAVERLRSHVLRRNPNHREGLAVLAAASLAREDQPTFERVRDAALQARPRDARFYTLAGEILNVLHRYPAALNLAREGVARLEDSPYAQSSFAIAALQLGLEAEGRAALERAWQRDRFNERTYNVRALYRDTIDREYIDIESPQFSLRLPRKHHEFVAPQIRRAYETAKAALDRRYGIDPGRLRIEVFATPEDFAIRTVGVPSLGAVGVCFGPVITVVGPYRGTHNFSQVLWHELAHTYALELSRGRVPRWFTEGLSEWESFVADASWARENAALLRNAKGSGQLLPMGQLELGFLRAANPMAMELAYTQAAYVLRFLGESFGLPAIMKALRGFGEGLDTDEAFRVAFGRSPEDLDGEFLSWLDRTLGHTGWSPAPPDTAPATSTALDQRFDRARRALAEQDHPAAREQLESLLTDADGYAVRMLSAQLAAQTQRVPDARQHLRAAIGFDPLAPEPWRALSGLESRAGNLAGEQAALAGWLALDAMSPTPAARMLTLATLTGDRPQAHYALTRLQAIAPLDPHALAGSVLAAAPSHPQATARLRLMDEQIAGGPGSAAALAALAWSHIGQPERAQPLAKLAHRDGSLPPDALHRLDAQLNQD